MAKRESGYPDWLLWVLDKGFLLVGIVSAVLLLGIVAVGFLVERRLEDIERQLDYRPPVAEGNGAEAEDLATGQTVYVPVYSHIYHDGGKAYLLEITLSIRNTDPERAITVRSVRYYDTKGQLVKDYLDAPLKLPPLGSTEFLVERKETSGGSGANFLVAWSAAEEVHEPLVEAVMVGTDEGGSGISFSRRGRVILDQPPRAEAR